MCLPRNFDITENWKMIIGHRDTYNKRKYLIISNVWMLDILRKVKYIWCSHFHEIISTNVQFGFDFFVITFPVMCKQKISKFSFFFKINVNVWLLRALDLMTSKSFILEDLTVNKMSVIYFVLCISWINFFAFWGAEKQVFHFSPFRPTR